jgi:GTP pyrophosphokinase
VKLKQEFNYLPDGSLNLSDWVAKIDAQYHLKQPELVQKAADLSYQLAKESDPTTKTALERGLATAGIILELNLGEEAAAAAVLCTAPILTRTQEELLKKQIGETVAKLTLDVKKSDIIPLLLKQQQTRNMNQIDKMRKMLLAMATDIRVVIIKLAERLCFLQSIKQLPATERKHYAQEIMDIYAPLANRLGIGQLKWELEDIAFHYLDPATYKTIANFLAERRVDREKRIHHLMETLREKLREANIQAEISGRPKHIYSIYLKASRKAVSYQEIYDHSAFRILVNTIEDCYQALSLVNSLWPPIIDEFDDYIANPKPNGYRSIHTAVIGEDGKHFEIQIRTHDMHDEAERGVAAHWMYKEKAPQPLDDAAKINYLRQLFDWQKEVAVSDQSLNESTMEDDNIYVITPAGDIQDLPKGATPLDFAYHIHTELGHRCRGAKVNKQIVPLTHELKTGDKVEIITVLQGSGSIKNLVILKLRARAVKFLIGLNNKL